MTTTQMISLAASAFLAICILPSVVLGSRVLPAVRFTLQGRVFCDTCLAGFETPATTYIEGATVRVECRGRLGTTTGRYDGVTDRMGTYIILVSNDHEHDICEVKLMSSPDRTCNTEVRGRERVRVFLSHNNGIASDTRFANALGYQKNIPLALCSDLMKQYQQDNE